MAEKKAKRERGRILTEAGWSRLDVALQAWEVLPGNKRTQERIALEAKIDDGTIAKILKRREKADLSKIEQLFRAFGLSLEESDHGSLPQTAADLNFVGREEAIANLTTLINRGAKVIVIQARGGVGKTTLARKYLQQKFEDFLEFPIAKETKDIASIESLIEEKLRQLGEEPGREFLVSIDRLKRKLQAEPIGILIDNLEPALDSAGKFIEPHRRYVELLRVLADPSVQSVTLITSRERLHEPSVAVQHYPLRSLEVAAWEKFFQLRQLATTPALTALHHAYGGNAKAMEILSSVIKQDYGENIEAYWQENQNDLLIERDLEDLVTQQFDRLQQVDPDAYKLLCRMGCYRYQDVPTVPIEGLFCLLWDVPENRQRRVVRALQERSLVEFEDKEFWLHPVIRSEAIGRLKECEDWEKTNQSVAEFWLKDIRSINNIDEALRAFEPYFYYFEIKDFNEACNVIIKKITSKWEWYNLEGGETIFNAHRRLGLSKKVTLSINQIIDKVTCEYPLGLLYLSLAQNYLISGQLHQAISSSSQAIQITIDCLESSKLLEQGKEFLLNRLKLAISVTKAFCHLNLLEMELAKEILNEIISSTEDIGFQNYVVEAYFFLAFIYSFENIEKAKEFANLSYELLQNRSLVLSEWCVGHRFLLLGETYKEIGETREAFEMFESAAAFADENNYVQLKAEALIGLAELSRKKGDFKAALLQHLEGMNILDIIGAKFSLAQAHHKIGLTYKAMNEFEESNQNLQEAIRLFTEMEAPKQVERVRRSMQS